MCHHDSIQRLRTRKEQLIHQIRSEVQTANPHSDELNVVVDLARDLAGVAEQLGSEEVGTEQYQAGLLQGMEHGLLANLDGRREGDADPPLVLTGQGEYRRGWTPAAGSGKLVDAIVQGLLLGLAFLLGAIAASSWILAVPSMPQ